LVPISFSNGIIASKEQLSRMLPIRISNRMTDACRPYPPREKRAKSLI